MNPFWQRHDKERDRNERTENGHPWEPELHEVVDSEEEGWSDYEPTVDSEGSQCG